MTQVVKAMLDKEMILAICCNRQLDVVWLQVIFSVNLRKGTIMILQILPSQQEWVL